MQSGIRRLPHALTDRLSPIGMPRYRIRIAKKNPYGIGTNLTQQSICSKYCGACPSNPFTEGGLYCTAGKSKRKVEENGCLCSECPLFYQCGGGKGYYCKYGTAFEMIQEDKEKSKDAIEDGGQPSLARMDTYTNRFLQFLYTEPVRVESVMKEIEKSKDVYESDIIYTDEIGDDKENREEIQVKGRCDQTILEVSLANNINHIHQCGGKARCSTCRIIILKGQEKLIPPLDRERTLLDRKGLPSEVRLACQTKATGDIKIKRLIYEESDITKAISEGTSQPGSFGKEKEVCVMFSDIRSFTPFTEKQLPYDVIHMLNKYFESIGEIIDRRGGYIDKYMGDGIMVIFGLDFQVKGDYIENAMKAAFEMLNSVEKLNFYLEKHFQHQFRIGIGLHCGPAILGTLGYSKKREFTAIGDTVNTASRIESATKDAESDILISEAGYQKVKDKFVWGSSFPVKLKGKAEEMRLYIPLGVRE